MKNRGGRPQVYTEQVLAMIPVWLADGWPLEAIAARIGSTPGSLFATCSRLGISLKGSRRPTKLKDDLVINLSPVTNKRLMAKAMALSMSREYLAAVVLEQVITDDLFNAVLDFDALTHSAAAASS